MYVSLHSTRVQRFPNSLAAGARKRIPGGGQPVPSGAPAGFPVTGLGKAASPAWSVPLSLAGPPLQETWRGRSGFIPALAAPTLAALCKQVSGRGSGQRQPAGAELLLQSRTLRLADSTTSLYLAILPPANYWPLRDAGSAWRRARAGFGFNAAEFGISVALGERRSLLHRPHELKFRAHWSQGSWRPAFRDSLRGPRNDVRGRHIFSGSRLRREGADSFWAPGIVRRPRGKGRSGFRPESLARRRSRRASQTDVPARARGLQRVARPVQPGLRAQNRRQGPRAPLASFASVPPRRGVRVRRRREHAPLLAAPAAPALRRSRALGGVSRLGARCRAFPGRRGSPRRSAGRVSSLPLGEEAPGFAGQGLACGRPPGAPNQPEPPIAALAAAATAAAPAAACSAVAAMPARGGEVRGRFQKLGLQCRLGKLGFLLPVKSRSDLGKGVDLESLCLRLLPESEGGMSWSVGVVQDTAKDRKVGMRSWKNGCSNYKHSGAPSTIYFGF